MKTNFKITIEADLEYPGQKSTKEIQEEIKNWLINFVIGDPESPFTSPSIPILNEPTFDGEITVRHLADAKIKATIEKEGEIFFQKEWDEIGNPYGD